MKKTLLLAAAALASFTIRAQDAPVARWAQLLDGSTTAGDQTSAVTYNGDNVYWLATMGSTETDNNITYAGERLFSGEPYNSGNSQTNNLCLLATNAQGAKQWAIYSNSGDYASNSGDVAVDKDGNIVFALKVRHGDDFNGDETHDAMNVIDADGTVFTYGTATANRNYGILIAKASPRGKILWHKYVSLSTTPAPGNEEVQRNGIVSDAVKTNAVAVDARGNIYVGGNYSADMTVAPGVVLPARNVKNAQIDAQTYTGAMYILKYDKDGNYLASAIGNDGLTQSQILNLEWVNNSLYVYGNAFGTDSNTLEFCGKSVDTGSKATPVFGQLDSDLTAVWLNKIDVEPVNGACVLQNSGITVVGNTIWLAGQFNGKFINPENPEEFIATANKTPREGCIVKLDATDGKWIKGTTSRSDEFTPAAAKTGLTGYFKVLQSPENPENIYVYGYVMNATVGIILREYNAGTLKANLDHSWSLVTQGGTPTCTAIAHNPETNMAFVTGRGNKAFKLIGDLETAATAKWGCVLAGVEMPASLKYSGVDSPVVEPVDGPVEYYNLSGVRVDAYRLAPGIHIRRQGSQVSKVLVR